MYDRAPDSGPNISGGGGIVFGEMNRPEASASASPSGAMTAIRKRWASGVAVVTAVDRDGGFRGVTATSFVVVSIEPPVVAVALSLDGSLHRVFEDGTMFGVSVLDRSQTFLAERFAGRAPVPDPALTGIPTLIHASGVPLIHDAIGWCICSAASCAPTGDHVLVLGDVQDGGTAVDTDDPLVHYEGRYRSLEAG